MKEFNQGVIRDLYLRFREIVEKRGLMDETVMVSGKILTPEEAIGRPDRQDFPLLTGKERLVEASFKGFSGQAFTDSPGGFKGSIRSVLEKKPGSKAELAVFISTLNAVCKSLGLTEKTVHCKDNEPEECAEKLVEYIEKTYGKVKVALVGFQPSMLEQLTKVFPVRILDLNRDKVGATVFGVKVEHGLKNREQVLQWCDIIVATGSTLANDTLEAYLTEKPVLFFGTTISGAASLLGLKRFCHCAC